MDWLNKDAVTKNSRKNICDQYLSITDNDFVKNFDNNENM